MSKRVRLFNKIILALITTIVISAVPFGIAQAGPLGTDKCYDTVTDKKTGKKKKVWNNSYEGYFTGDCASDSWTKQGNVINGGVDAKNAKDLIDDLHRWYSGVGQNKVGAAFIVKTMLGKDSKGGGKSISSSEWDDVEARIKALDSSHKINWSSSVNRCTTNSYYQSEHKDDSFYKRDSKCGNDPAIKFSGGYVLDKKCANPLGSLDPLPKPDWKVSTSTSISAPSLVPGATITWTHKVTNQGPDATTDDVKYRYENSSGMGSGNGSDHTFKSGAKKNDTDNFKSTHVITQNDVGNNLCRATSASPKAWDSSSRTTSSSACVAIPYNYSLTPSLTANVSGAIEANTSFNVTPAVISSGPTKSKNTQWQITQIVVQPSVAVPNAAGGNSNAAPCGTYFSAPSAVCSTISSGNTVFSQTGARLSGSMIAATSVTAGDYEVGTKICYAFSVQPRASSVPANPGLDNQWQHSAPVCIVIGKKPKVQIWGGDLTVGGLVQTSTSVKNIGGQHVFGSWDEYGIFAVNSINGMGSGSAFAGSGLAIAGTTITSTDICNFSTLSFTNAGSTTCTTPGNTLGKYVTLRTNPDVAVSFLVNALDLVHNLGNNPPSIDLSVGGLQGAYGATGAVSVTGGGAGKVIAKGQWIVINVPNSDVTITGNINYTSEALANINDIPQVVIIAKDINILDTVTNVDAWLIAVKNPNDLLNVTGAINTCSSVAPPLSSNLCNQQLTVNGPVMANKLYLRRTAGSGTGGASGDPAELFNMRPDAYMWAYARASSSGHIQTVKTTELPPRF